MTFPLTKPAFVAAVTRYDHDRSPLKDTLVEAHAIDAERARMMIQERYPDPEFEVADPRPREDGDTPEDVIA